MLYLQQLCSDYKGGAPLNTQLKADGKAGENKVVPSISSSGNRENSNRKHLEFNKNCFFPIILIPKELTHVYLFHLSHFVLR